MASSSLPEFELLRRISEWLRPEYEQILSIVRGLSVVYTDQTEIKVDGANFWIWDFVTEPATLFALRIGSPKKYSKRS